MTDLLSSGNPDLFWDRLRSALQGLRPARLSAPATRIDGRPSIATARPAMDPETDAALDWAWHTARRMDGPVSLLLIGIDRRDDYLRIYGSETGEDCARLVGEAISSALPTGEVSFLRFGPGEFLVLLPGMNRGMARKLGRRVLGAVRQCRFSHKESHAGVVTASAGLASAMPDAWQAGEVLRRAATGLRKAQRGGLGRISVNELRGSVRRAA
ncbi:MAG: diguanylate cyclase [Devosia sp.]|jgi:diguanylate cyclase (GGDEF)-like protein|nr:diguanylate cyclase [Devosia sp.]